MIAVPFLLITVGQTLGEPAGAAIGMVTVAAGNLRAVFRDNSRSPEVLSGLASLVNVQDAADFQAFDPLGGRASAGLNFEHIISGHPGPNMFTPRHGPYRLYPVPGEHAVLLVRRADEDPWSMASTAKYTLVAPDAVDYEFRCVPHDATKFGAQGWACLFWANYMNDVVDAALHFRGVTSATAEETWIAADAPPQGPWWNQGGTYRHRDAAPLTFEGENNASLNIWSYDWPRYTEPFYYGRAARDMVFLLMFDRSHTPKDEIRFSLFKFKLAHVPRPAWDFQYVIHRVEAGREYGFRARLVWKRFVSPEDCEREYTQWRAGLSPRWP